MKALLALCLLAAPAAADPTHVLDFDLTQKGSSYVMSDDAYSIAFPGKPDIQAQDTPAAGMKIKTVAATYIGSSDVYGFFVVPVPKGVAYDVQKGMVGARDGALNNVHGTLVKEDDTVFGGLKGRHSLGTATLQGITFTLDIYVVWDEPHRTLLGGFTATKEAKATASDQAFIASFKTNPKGKTPR